MPFLYISDGIMGDLTGSLQKNVCAIMEKLEATWSEKAAANLALLYCLTWVPQGPQHISGLLIWFLYLFSNHPSHNFSIHHSIPTIKAMSHSKWLLSRNDPTDWCTSAFWTCVWSNISLLYYYYVFILPHFIQSLWKAFFRFGGMYVFICL